MTNKNKKYYPEIEAAANFPKIEEKILSKWASENTFKKSISNRDKSKEFVFYDGPPFANGLPHYGHILTGFVKDIIPRYQTMKGSKVDRVFGWDCHGLPAEMESEKELGISGRKQIQDFGVEKFNDHCQESVMRFTKEWEVTVGRQARWVDFENDYKTMDKNYMESVIWAFKQLWDKGLIYEKDRVMPYSWKAETPLSNFETRLDDSYRERKDPAVTVKFEIKESNIKFENSKKSYLLAWTTTHLIILRIQKIPSKLLKQSLLILKKEQELYIWLLVLVKMTKLFVNRTIFLSYVPLMIKVNLQMKFQIIKIY